MALSDGEITRVKYHLGLEVVGDLRMVSLGVRSKVIDNYAVDGNLANLSPGGEFIIRQILADLDAADAQRRANLELLQVKRLDTIEVNENEQRELMRNYLSQVQRLRAALGMPAMDPNDRRGDFYGITQGGSINAKVLF